MPINNLDELFREELKDLFDAEKQLVKALPKMAKAATNPDLKAAFEEHLEVTRGQVERLKQVFEVLGLPARGKECKAMKGLIEESSEMIEEDAEDYVKDAGLIVAAQKVEHYEIAGYGSLATWAETTGHTKVAKLLGETLAEEKEADEKLNELAEGTINEAAEAA